jgi:hypothetical protein
MINHFCYLIIRRLKCLQTSVTDSKSTSALEDKEALFEGIGRISNSPMQRPKQKEPSAAKEVV